MKAYQILLFLFLFNMMFWVLTSGLGIFDIGASPSEAYNISEQAENPTSIEGGFLSLLGMLGGDNIYLLAGALAGGAMLGYFTAGQGPQGIVYGAFAVFFWTSFFGTLRVFITLGQNNIGLLYVLIPFVMIVGVIFVVGLFQMVTGGWKSFE